LTSYLQFFGSLFVAYSARFLGGTLVSNECRSLAETRAITEFVKSLLLLTLTLALATTQTPLLSKTAQVTTKIESSSQQRSRRKSDG
jgi:hypothetical protein